MIVVVKEDFTVALVEVAPDLPKNPGGAFSETLSLVTQAAS